MPYKTPTWHIRFRNTQSNDKRLITVDAMSFDVAQRLARYELPEGLWAIFNAMYLPNRKGQCPKLLTLEQALELDDTLLKRI